MIEIKRVQILRDSDIALMSDTSGVESLMFKLGLNTENSIELPSCMMENGGGLKIWQYPSQFSKYLIQLSKLGPIHSYIEIGCRWGGTFILTTEYLSKFRQLKRAVAVDLIESPVEVYCDFNPVCEFKQIDSHSEDFKEYMRSNTFDVVFIDGDHSYEGVRADYEICKDSGKIFVFHDIVNAHCEGVVQFWNELRSNSADVYDFYEFIDQYEEVVQRTGKRFLGIGVAVTKRLHP